MGVHVCVSVCLYMSMLWTSIAASGIKDIHSFIHSIGTDIFVSRGLIRNATVVCWEQTNVLL